MNKKNLHQQICYKWCVSVLYNLYNHHTSNQNQRSPTESCSKVVSIIMFNIRNYTVRNKYMIGCFCIWYHFSSYLYVILIFESLYNHYEIFSIKTLCSYHFQIHDVENRFLASLKAYLLSDDYTTTRKILNANNLFIRIALQHCRVGIPHAHSHLLYNLAILRA